MRRAGGSDDAARGALEELCATYWPAVYALYRREGLDPEAARDLTQGLLLDLLQREDFGRADPARGRFRSFLRGCARHYLANRREHEGALKRGGGRAIESLDIGTEERIHAPEPVDAMDPDAIFERRWAIAVLDTALAAVQREETECGRGRLFAVLRPILEGESLPQPYAELAAELGTSEGALRVTAHRLRQRFRRRLLEEVGHTLDRPELLGDELDQLLGALRAGR
ncbi:MAG: sigma-70 family RNA polymerase sigma factor [Planctomycetes bacterium]|nr:sigma-70 family RNA polymerase sigma factor [Planctomycetota bacterium]